jgi:hypothetical protein
MNKTRLAILGTISDLHNQSISYDLNCLRRILVEVSPDLLCAEITRQEWERGDLSKATLEVREAFAQTVSSMDIVLIPIASTSEQFADFRPRTGWRQRLVRTFTGLLRWGQIQADDVSTINGQWFGVFCHTVCWLTERFWTAEDRLAWDGQNEKLVENIVQAVQRDSGRRVLVAVQCQRLHRLISLLRTHRDLVELVPYQDL